MTTRAEARSAVLLGATGLVGRSCLDLLLGDPAYDRVLVIARKAATRENPKLRWFATDLAELHQCGRLLDVDDVFCCLGTTIRAAGSREAFRRVDFGYVVGAAQAAAENGARQLLLISAVGADPGSRVFYSRVKGEVEGAVGKLPFRGTQIFRPSLLLGKREQFRLGERIAALALPLVSFLLVGPARKYRPIKASAVAAAMLKVAATEPPGVNVFESNRIAALAAA
ncbi:MAG TPA: NAD(P)H-binding protein [Thermoanaerobaculaceae bacterium]|nr:NAD(P)H-binding protein [Thermoanaerobaculaceae bacterium]